MATVTPSSRSTRWAERELDRVAAFSDGVFAIAITLLVLNLAVPTVPDDQPGHALRALRDDFTAYLIGFAVMGGFWYGHHRLFSRMKRSNPRLVVANLVLLALIGLMPFTTALLGRYDEPLAIAIYAVNVGLASLVDGVDPDRVPGGAECGAVELATADPARRRARPAAPVSRA
jgi:uncharacterized membrane protein